MKQNNSVCVAVDKNYKTSFSVGSASLIPLIFSYIKKRKILLVDSKNFDDVFNYYLDAIKNDTNLLLNVGPLPDGSIHHEDIITLTKLGEKINELQ